MALADEMIKTLMKNLDCDEETAKDVIECDKRIDKGEKLFELDENQKKAEKKMRSVGCKTVNPYGKPTVREKPQDRRKRFLIDIIVNALNNHILGGANYKIINPEREIEFEYCGRKFKIVLSCPRT